MTFVSWILDGRPRAKQGQREGTRNRNDKSEMRGSLHFGGKCAAFGRDDAFWVGLNPLNKNNVGNNNETNATATRQTQQQRNQRNSNETNATPTKQTRQLETNATAMKHTRQLRNKRDSYETYAAATKQTRQQPILDGEAVKDGPPDFV
jgi:hypothetical protein